MLALLQQLGVPVQRKVVEDGVVFGVSHVVRQARTRQGNGHVMHQLVVLVDHAIVHVGRMFGVVEKQQLAIAFVHFAMGRNAVQR